MYLYTHTHIYIFTYIYIFVFPRLIQIVFQLTAYRYLLQDELKNLKYTYL